MPPLNTLENVLSYVKKLENGCWEWTGARDKHGYGALSYKGESWRAHVLIYTLIKGPVPFGKILHHRCEFKSCVNPEHQGPLSHGAHRLIHTMNRTYCARNHELTFANTYITPEGRRTCLTCRRENLKLHRKRKAQTKSRRLRQS